MTSKPRDTEVDAYAFIRRELEQLGWDCRNPSRVADGKVWTQNQCLADDDIRLWLDKKRPENIIKVDSTHLWVIEAKQKRTEIDTAVDEAENYYAARLNQSKVWHVSLVSGVAGNDVDGYSIRNLFEEKGAFKPILLNDKETTGLISPDTAKRLLGGGVPTSRRWSLTKLSSCGKRTESTRFSMSGQFPSMNGRRSWPPYSSPP